MSATAVKRRLATCCVALLLLPARDDTSADRCPGRAVDCPHPSHARARRRRPRRPRSNRSSKKADALRQAGKLPEAVAADQEALRVRPSWTEGRWYVGTLNYELEKPAPARQAFPQSHFGAARQRRRVGVCRPLRIPVEELRAGPRRPDEGARAARRLEQGTRHRRPLPCGGDLGDAVPAVRALAEGAERVHRGGLRQPEGD